MKICELEMNKIKKIFICIFAVTIMLLSLLTSVNAYSYSAAASVYYTECSGHENGIHYTFNKGIVAAKKCQGIMYSDGETGTRKSNVYLELRRRAYAGLGYKSFGEKSLGTITEGAGWTNLNGASWQTDEKNSTYYIMVYMPSSHIQKKFKCTLSQ